MVETDKLNRRSVVAGLGAVAGLRLAAPAWAVTGAQAEKLVQNSVAEITKIIASGKSESGMLRDFERVFSRYADVNIIALTTLGPARRSASLSQVAAYTNAF